MAGFKVGDLVTRCSYGSDLLFKIVKINRQRNEVVLKGDGVRLLADAPIDDLKIPDGLALRRIRDEPWLRAKEKMRYIYKQQVIKHQKRWYRRSRENFFEVPPKILHIDGDSEYLEESLRTFSVFGLNVIGEHVKERKLPEKVPHLLRKHQPDILIITGHDACLRKRGGSLTDLRNYRNSRYFIEGTRAARTYEQSKDDLIIFAGACQSHYEALLEAGANFASSPQRALIHTLDPVFVVQVIAFTPIYLTINISEAILNTVSGLDGIGGIESRGKFRFGLPKSHY